MAFLSFLNMSNLFPRGWTITGLLNDGVAVLVGYIIYSVVRFFFWYQYIKKVFKDVPGPKDTHWLYGNLHLLPGNTGEDFVESNVKTISEFPRYYRMWNGPFNVLLISVHPEITRKILHTSEPKPTSFTGGYRFGLPWLGRGLLIAEGERWSQSRRLLTPAFHFDILKPYIDVYNDAANILLEKLHPVAMSGKSFEVFQVVSLCTFDVILRCAFSYSTDCQRKGDTHPYVQAVKDLSDTWSYRGRKPYLYPDIIFYLTSRGRRFKRNCDLVHSVAEDVIKNRRASLDQQEHSTTSTRKYLDFLDILLTAKDENGKGMTQLEIRNEVDTFLFEGHDTTASAISWILYSLAKHQDIQEKVLAELDSVLEGRDTDNLQWNDLNKLEYLTMVIKEGMRDHCPVPFIQRQFTKDFELEGKTFPAGTCVSIHMFGLHHNETVWEKPMEFIPERFSKENTAKMDTYQFVPFSAGPRNCIGQHFAMNEEKVILAKLVHRYKFELDPDHRPKKKVATVMRSDNGIMLRISKR
ncbi:hypothetical protein CHS0354_037442 [Potamilus streckersoni]|uniref:Cytochrome P450 n=1 Tax=Potamilus streckersoni TaxID=2493646 RepID=A0AAE0SM84_9BIVA|nr:hypothetical protein CHS0354_037442 [Potamilus streckersoni]